MDTIKTHVDFVLSVSDNEKINSLMKQKNISKPELLRKALALYIAANNLCEQDKLNICSAKGIVVAQIKGF